MFIRHHQEITKYNQDIYSLADQYLIDIDSSCAFRHRMTAVCLENKNTFSSFVL